MTTTTPPTRHDTTHAAPNWARALCAQTDPELFFANNRSAHEIARTEQAKQVCAACPIQMACRTWSIRTEQAAGVWGGLDEHERRAILRREASRKTSYERCIAEQEFIERRIAEGGTHRQIAAELGVGHNAVGRAWRFFESERAADAAKAVAA